MAGVRLPELLRYLRRAAAPAEAPVGSDAQLLERFATARDEDAFELLVRRHGPMVLSVCRRVLGDAHEAEDAFQAAFLVLARKAPAAARCRSAGAWLHTVAYRVALRARSSRAARTARERPLDEPVPAGDSDPALEAVKRDVRRVIDEEVSRLPEKYRVPFVLFHLEGRSSAEVARDLGCPVGTVESWLSRARARLRAALARRGLAPTPALLPVPLAHAGPPAVPAALLRSTVRAAPLVAAGRAVAAGTVPARVASLLKAVRHDALVSRFRMALWALLLVGLVGVAATFVARQLLADDPGAPLQAARPAPAPGKAEEPGPEAPLLPQVVRVTDINRNGSSNPSGLVNVNGTLFFSADDGEHGRELWKCTRTPNGPVTALVRDVNRGQGDSNPIFLTDVNGTLFFLANDGVRGHQLWKSDGTEAGTVLVKYVPPGPDHISFAPSGKNLVVAGKLLFFVAWDGHRYALWKSDGTEAGTGVVKGIDASWAVSTSLRRAILPLKGTLYFVGEDPVHGIELWKSDGTEAGTVLVKDVNPGPGNSYPTSLTNVNGTLFFVAEHPARGPQLWKSDGTEAGTVLVKDVNPGGTNALPGRDAPNLTAVGKTLFFASLVKHGGELWSSDGTEAGTAPVRDTRVGGQGLRLAPGPRGAMAGVNGTLFFAAEGVHGWGLWKCTPTPNGPETTLVKDVAPGVPGARLDVLTDVNGTLFFAAGDGVHCKKLWKSDGTEAGTVPVKEFFPADGLASDRGPQYLAEFTVVDGTVFFAADWHPSKVTWEAGRELWCLPAPRRPGR
jgi:RNA polymerase sigma factor (sigma-70 family)